MKHSILYLATLALMASCAKKHECGELATVRNYTGLDCCNWVIELESGTVIQPENLNEFISSPEDGSEVYVTYHADSLFGCCMVGDIVILDCLEEK